MQQNSFPVWFSLDSILTAANSINILSFTQGQKLKSHLQWILNKYGDIYHFSNRWDAESTSCYCHQKAHILTFLTSLQCQEAKFATPKYLFDMQIIMSENN